MEGTALSGVSYRELEERLREADWEGRLRPFTRRLDREYFIKTSSGNQRCVSPLKSYPLVLIICVFDIVVSFHDRTLL